MFIVKYLSVFYSWIRSFQFRNYLKAWQILIIIILLNSLLMAPLSFQIGRIQAADLANYLPETMELIDDAVAEDLNNLTFSEGKLVISAYRELKKNDQGLVALHPDEAGAENLLAGQAGIIFTPQKAFLANEEGSILAYSYQAEPNFHLGENSLEVKERMSQDWFSANRSAIILTNFIYIWLLVFVSQIILILGASFFLSLMGKNRNYQINSYKEAVTIILNCLGLPSLLAFLVGFVTADPTTLLTIQGLGLVVMLLSVYWQTHFNDAYLTQKLQKEEFNKGV